MAALTLDDTIITLGPLAKRLKAPLAGIGITTIRDLIFYLPFRHEDWSAISSFHALTHGMNATVVGTIASIEKTYAPWRRSYLTKASLADESGSYIHALWFHAPYLTETLPAGTRVRLSGKVERRAGVPTFIHPTYEKDTATSVHTGRLVPVYHLTDRVTQKQIRGLVALALKRIRTIPDFLPPTLLRASALLPLDRAIRTCHFPPTMPQWREAAERLKYNELFFLQLRSQRARRARAAQHGIPVRFQKEAVVAFVRTLPFSLTRAQRVAAWEILRDLEKTVPMNRLLEGDVGSGKTIVAALAAYNTLQAGHPVAYLAPTSILATQQYETFCRLFAHTDYSLALITQGDIRLKSQKSKVKSQNYERISKKELISLFKEDAIDMVIGTHALLSEYVSLSTLALVIVDEQHRFGVRQRHTLLAKTENHAPHLLSMTATPIPRSLALVAYGDLDISLLREKPQGRAAITTKIILPEHRREAYALIRDEIAKGRQAYIVCPLIDPSDRLGVKSVQEEVLRLSREHFPDLNLGLLHGRMKQAEKERIMRAFVDGATHVLVATPVIEVGIDVPNATCILIEGAERYGLAQLHQLRGRVGRSDHPSYCLLASDAESENALTRLRALVSSADGFKLAELDLDMRGPGKLYGTVQSGFLDELKIAKLTDVIPLKKAKETVDRLLSEDPTLARFPGVLDSLQRFEQSVHFE